MGRRVRVNYDGGWFVGTVVSDTVSAAGKRVTPGATHIVEFDSFQARDVRGKKPVVLKPAGYGSSKVWLLLNPAATESESSA